LLLPCLLQSLLDPFSKLLSFVLQYGVFSLSYLVEICGLCYKNFSKVNKPLLHQRESDVRWHDLFPLITEITVNYNLG